MIAHLNYIDNILTPKAELSLNDIKGSNISGIVKDRFFVSANPMVYNPSGSKVQYRTRINSGGEKDSWSDLQTSNQISFFPENVGSYELDILAVDNRIAFSEIVTIPFSIGRIWYLDPKTAIPFWGSILLLIGFSTVTYINYRKKSIEAQELREAEIERQQAEMEEAREFQQAMLPKEMPSTDDYEMVGFQQTATEVGGDFFDFMQKEDGMWIAICGDATGHGLTSGNVVSITKTAMSSLVEEEPIPTLDSLNETLLKMNIGLNRMCLNIANIGKDSIRFSSAGMPPAYYYSAEKGELEEVLVGALPLGSFPNAIHMEQEISFKNKGDILVMMSDGLPEAENLDDEMVGYERTEEKIRSLADRSAEEIKDGLVELCDSWLDGHAELKDDMTFVTDCKNPKAVSILVRAGSEHVADEIERNLDDAIGVVSLVVKDGKIVTGGGAAEIELALKLRKFAPRIGGRDQMAIESFAQAIEVVPNTLAENAGLDVIDTLMGLRKSHTQKGRNPHAGLDAYTGKVVNMRSRSAIY
mgnify:CR=1 FL=1